MALYDKPTKSLNISLVCDKPTINTENLNVVANIHLWSQLMPRNSTNWSVTLRPNGVQYDKVIPVNELLKGDFNEHNAYLEFQLRRGQKPISRTYYFPSNIASAVGITDPELEVSTPCYSEYCTLLSTSITSRKNMAEAKPSDSYIPDAHYSHSLSYWLPYRRTRKVYNYSNSFCNPFLLG